MKTPAISIVMPVYNGALYLNESIDSILNQTFSDFELIIIDDGSTDNSINIVNNYNDSRIILIQKEHNFIESLNIGISISRGKYIARMDADDIMLSDRLDVQFDYMEKNPYIDVCGGWMETFGNAILIQRSPIKHEEIVSKLLITNTLFHPTIILRRESISKFISYPNIYKESYIYAEDYKLWTDLAIYGYKFSNIPEVLIKYRKSTTQNCVIFNSERIRNRDRIQFEYLNTISEKIVENYQDVFNFVDNAIELCNLKYLKINTLQDIISEIYFKQLFNQLVDKKIKILFCIPTLGGGGAEKLLIDILKHFDFDKYYVELLIIQSSGIYFKDIPCNVNWFTLDDVDRLDEKYDIEVAFLEGLATKYIARRKSNAQKYAWVHANLFDFHWTNQFYQNGEEEKCYSLMDSIVFVSNDVKNQFNLLFPNIKGNQHVVYNLIDKKNIQEKSNFPIIKTRKLTICTVGRLGYPKGYLELIPVINRLVEEKYEFDLWIIGEGEERKQLESLINQYSLEDVVHLKGFDKNPYPYIKASDIFLSTSFSEGFPLVVCEAICLEKAILATNISGTREILDYGKFGFLVDPNKDSIYEGLKKMIKDIQLREYYSQQSQVRATLFNVKKSMSQIYDILDN